MRFDRAFGVIEPKREPRPGAERARVAESPASACYEDTNDDEDPKEHQRKGGLDRCLERRLKQTRFFPRAGEGLRLGEEPAGHSIFANEVDELALNADPVRAENARLIGRIGGF